MGNTVKGFRGRLGRVVSVCVACAVLMDMLIVDKWTVSGDLKDAKTGEPLRNAWIVADFKGREPLIVLPISPHPSSRTGACMGSRVTRTDQNGVFRFTVLTANRALADKSAFIMAFTPGWFTGGRSVSIGSSLFTAGPKLHLQLEKGPGPIQFTTKYSERDPANVLPASELGYVEELFSTLRVLANDLCEPHVGAPMDIAALEHALSIAATFDERERVRSWCRTRKAVLLEDSERVAGLDWPFDCENLPFKHQPSPEVLAVEAELEAKRKAAVEHKSSAAPATTAATPQ